MSYKTEIKGDSLIITVDISQKAIDAAELNDSGNKRIASSGGFQPIKDGSKVKLGLNVIQIMPKDKSKK